MKLFCKLPFTRISVDDDGNVWPACCPYWVQFPMGNVFKQSWEEIWMGDAAKRLRDSMFDGSLKYCDRNWCPHVANVEAGVKDYHVVPIEEGFKEWSSTPPVHVNLNYDQTCNLKCPTCRTDFIHYRHKDLNRVQFIQEYAEQKILPTVESIALTGVGDPFMSRVFRNFLMNFDSGKYPNIKTIHFHTNGLLFDEKMYNKMKGIHHLQISTDISIDAASAEVYSMVRPPGKWQILMKNLEFIKRLDNLILLGISMVVQPSNYHQMSAFVELADSLVYGKRETFVEFKRNRHWPHLSNEEFKKVSMDNVDEKAKEKFLDILHRIERKRLARAKKNKMPYIQHNLYEYLQLPRTKNTIYAKTMASLKNVRASFFNS